MLSLTIRDARADELDFQPPVGILVKGYRLSLSADRGEALDGDAGA